MHNKVINVDGFIDKKLNHPIYRYVKRLTDICISLIGILIMIIPTIFIAVFIKLDSKGPVFFKQKRVGYMGRLFTIYKFRTMSDNFKKSKTSVNSNCNEVTRIGKFLRKTSIDEMPQLINIFKGDMSFVGPRPLIENEGEIHNLRMKNGVYNVRPGLTGLAQINGRDLISDEEKVKLDTQYVKEFDAILDIKLFFATIPKSLIGSDVAEEAHQHI